MNSFYDRQGRHTPEAAALLKGWRRWLAAGMPPAPWEKMAAQVICEPYGFEEILGMVAEISQVTRAELLGRRKRQRIVRPRQVAMVLAAELCPERSYGEIAEFFRRDHTCVIHAVAKKERLLACPIFGPLYGRARAGLGC